MALGTTSNAAMTRNQLIDSSFSLIGEDRPETNRLSMAVRLLNSIIRELDKETDLLWAVTNRPSSITISANTIEYTSEVPDNILRLESAIYRNTSAEDTEVEVLTTHGYSRISDKTKVGSKIEKVYLPADQTLSNRILFTWPAIGTVNSQSSVTGTDALAYKCIKTHVADSTNRPITGANYLLYWALGGAGGTWTSGEQFTAPEQLLFWYRRPLFDFDLSSDNPDVPLGWDRLIMYRLAYDLSFSSLKVSSDVRQQLQEQILMAKANINPSKEPVTTDIYNKALFF